MHARMVQVALVALTVTVRMGAAAFVHTAASGGTAGDMISLVKKDSALAVLPDSQGATPLMHASGAGNTSVMTVLLDAGVPLDATDSLDRDALDWAMFAGAYDAARLLADRGADLNRVYESGQTRLSLAAARADVAATGFLLMSGADKALKNRDGLSPLDAAKSSKNDAVIGLVQSFEPVAPVTPPPSRLSAADSAKLYAVRTYERSEELLEAVRQGRRSFGGCTLVQLDLSNANLALLDLRGCDLSGCDARGALFTGADLRGATLRNAYLRNADLRRARLDSATLTDAYLTRADLRQVQGLSLEQLKRTRNLHGATLESELAELVKQYCQSHLKDPGTDWVGNPWYAKSTVKVGDRPE